jgi:hypothetical protein
MGWIRLAQDRDQGKGSCEHGNGPLDSIIEKPRCWRLLKKDSASCS